MAINVKFDLLNNPEPPTLVLANRNGNKLGQLDVNHESIELIDKFNEASEISFTVNKYVDGKITPLWDKLVDFKLVYCKEWDMWFECKVELDEATESVKTVFCTQLGQAELSQIMLYNIEINTEDDIARDDYKITILYDPEDSQASLLHRLLEKAPHYSIKSVANTAPTLVNIQRSFSFDGVSVYDALQEIAEEIGCLFVFNSDSDEYGMPQRTISVYDLQQNCNDCNHRGEFTDKCPKCGSTNIKQGYGEDTLIFVTSDELASEGIQLVTDTDSVKNCFKLEAGDDLMTATIRNRNPNGTDYIWYFSDATKSDMPNELVEKIDEYDETYRYYYNEHESNLDSNLLNQYNILVDKYVIYNEEIENINNPIIGFSSLMNAYYNTIDLGWYLKSGLMPDVKMGKTNAEEQGLLLETSLPSLIAVANLDTVSKATADSSMLTMAKAIVSSAYKVSITSSSLSDNDWSGKFVITNYSDDEDTYITNTISRTLTDWEETYIQQKIDKILGKENTDDLSITGLFAKDYDEFCDELHKYALTPLTSFHDACQACLDILIEQGVGSDDSDLYEGLYLPYYNKLKAIEAEMEARENEVNIVIDLQTNVEKIKAQIQKELNFQNYLGENLWLQFCAYRREDKYSNSNYISDGLNNAELFERAQQFYEVAENEIFKSAELQHSISATLNNLLAIPKFRPLVESFAVGNWIRVQIDDYVYKLRLVEYEISYGDFDSISVEFSDVAKTKNGYSDLEDILSDASSMASSYDSIQRQANLGNEARNMIRQWITEGLDASLVQIQNNTNEDIVIDNNGLIGRSYSDITEEYSDEQIRLTHNIIAFTDDNWKSVTQAIGKHKHTYYDEGKKEFVDAIDYGMSANFVQAGFISGSQIIGGNIYSDNYSITDATGSYINLRDGTFSFGGGALSFYDGKLMISANKLDSDSVTEINDEWLKTTTVYAQNLNVNAANINGTLTADKIDASELKVDAANITGKLNANQIEMDMTGTITWNDLATDVQNEIDTANQNAITANENANTAAEWAVQAKNTANGIVDDWGYTYDGTTYIDGRQIYTGTVTASKLQGGEVRLLSKDGNDAGVFSITDADSGSYAIDISSDAALRLSAEDGNLFLGTRKLGATDEDEDPWNTFIELSPDTVQIKGTMLDFYGWSFFTGDVTPTGDNEYRLGLSGLQWADIFAVNSTISTSDATKKKDIEYSLDPYDNFYDSLKPVSYKFIDNQSDRTHIGFISQDVETSLVNSGLTSKDFAGFIKSPITDKDTNEVTGYNYALRYGEFIALNTWQIQKLKTRIEKLEAKIEELTAKLEALE